MNKTLLFYGAFCGILNADHDLQIFFRVTSQIKIFLSFISNM